ncbi:MAG: hypothetical protein AAGD10_12840 [Myxococcota bacterium]
MTRIPFALGAICLIPMIGCGDEDPELTPCTDFTECGTTEICSPAGFCVDEGETTCTTDEECMAVGGTCDTSVGICASGNGGGGCTDASDCGGGEICDNGQCVPDSMTGDCTDATDCNFGEVCADMSCVVPSCNSVTDCAPTGDLCQDDPDNPDFDMCVAADDVSSGCAPTLVWGEAREPGGPVITNVGFLGNADLEGDESNCTAANALSFQATVYSEDGLPTAINSQGIRQIRGSDPGMDAERFVFSNGVGTPSHPSVADLGNNEFNVVFSLCRASMMEDVFAVMVLDVDGEQSNGFCFNVGNM